MPNIDAFDKENNTARDVFGVIGHTLQSFAHRYQMHEHLGMFRVFLTQADDGLDDFPVFAIDLAVVGKGLLDAILSGRACDRSNCRSNRPANGCPASQAESVTKVVATPAADSRLGNELCLAAAAGAPQIGGHPCQ